MIVLSAGMQKAGTAWYFNLTNDCLVAAGHQDVHTIRRKFHLNRYLLHYNNNIGAPTKFKLALLTIPHFCGNTFVVKTHMGPSRSLRYLMSLGIFKATFIYRDPRDVVISGFEHGQRIRDKGETHTFAKWDTIETSIFEVKRLLAIWDKWVQCSQVLIVRYEDLLTDTVHELKRLVSFLSLDGRLRAEDLHRIISTYQTNQLDTIQKNYLHFNKGTTERFKKVMNQRELNLCRKHFGEYLQRMGYSE